MIQYNTATLELATTGWLLQHNNKRRYDEAVRVPLLLQRWVSDEQATTSGASTCR